MHYGSGWGFLLMSVSVLAFGVLVVVATVLIVRALVRDNRSAQQVADPRQILAQRFARGEIDETEYRNRLSVLHHPATPPT
jgi:putative membrane protein